VLVYECYNMLSILKGKDELHGAEFCSFELHYNEVLSRPYISPIGSYFGKLLELLLKGAKVDGCKPSCSSRLCPKHSVSPQYI
jgi:hypothetical protein